MAFVRSCHSWATARPARDHRRCSSCSESLADCKPPFALIRSFSLRKFLPNVVPIPIPFFANYRNTKLPRRKRSKDQSVRCTTMSVFFWFDKESTYRAGKAREVPHFSRISFEDCNRSSSILIYSPIDGSGLATARDYFPRIRNQEARDRGI